MALRISTALRNFLLTGGSLKDALQNGQIKVYSGAQPSSPDDAPSGTLLATITKSSGARTAEVLSSGSVTLTGGSSGSVDSITVDGVNIMPEGAISYATSLSNTASLVAAAINQGLSSPEYTASASGAVITIKAKRGTGAGPNTFVVAATTTTLTHTDVDMSGGVAAVNGLTLAAASAGSVGKKSTETWSGVAAASGTAGWFRFEGSVADSGVADASEAQIRLDGSVATSGAQLTMASTNVVSGATQTVGGFTASFAESQS